MDSLTTLMANLVVACTADFQFDPSSSVALDLMAFSEGSECLTCPVPVTDCMGSRAALSGLCGKLVRWIP